MWLDNDMTNQHPVIEADRTRDGAAIYRICDGCALSYDGAIATLVGMGRTIEEAQQDIRNAERALVQ